MNSGQTASVLLSFSSSDVLAHWILRGQTANCRCASGTKQKRLLLAFFRVDLTPSELSNLILALPPPELLNVCSAGFRKCTMSLALLPLAATTQIPNRVPFQRHLGFNVDKPLPLSLWPFRSVGRNPIVSSKAKRR